MHRGRDIQATPTVLAEAAHCALSVDTQICNLTAGKGHPACALSLKILDKGVGTPDRGGISVFPAPFAHG